MKLPCEWILLAQAKRTLVSMFFVATQNSSNEKRVLEKKIMDLENRLVVAKGEGKGAGWIGNLGLIDAA